MCETVLRAGTLELFGWNSAPRWLSIIHAVRAGKRNSGTVTPGVVLYTSFLLLLTFLARGPSCYGHLASVIRQHLPHDWCSLGTTVAAVWLKTPPFLTCKTVRVMLLCLCVSARCKEVVASDSELWRLKMSCCWHEAQNSTLTLNSNCVVFEIKPFLALCTSA